MNINKQRYLRQYLRIWCRQRGVQYNHHVWLVRELLGDT